jgi:formylglycine-generating enzyme required for sulfatase activity
MATTPTLPAADQDDWLGYGAYADALWSRVIRALDKDKGGKLLGDDPLVIGIFGEWGAGKSHLLKLVHRRAEEQSARDIAVRVLTAADDLTVPITVTVPVMFQPWKYEHEPHLHVPLAIHVADALEDAWKKLPTDFEHVKEFVERATEGLADASEKIEVAKGLMVQIGKIWGATKQVVHSNVTKVVAGTVDLAAMSFGVPPLLTGLLSKAKDHVAEPDDESEDDAEKGKSKDADKSQKAAKKTAAEKRTTSFSHSEDGLAFYRIHKLMQAMTRPKIGAKTLSDAGLKIANGIEFDLRINFVVFVDDLDRCLPEKAVETLELIKTTFNIESFAFVLALDDEVIERGIGHRYKDYFLQGKKPDMPITGFEYLEKIVHLPFRLPALTRNQAREFLIRYEESIEADAPARWFAPIAGQPMTDSTYRSPDNIYAATGIKLDLVDLALSAFDAYVPRKLIRMVELTHQIASIAQKRMTPLARRHAGKIPVDTRVVLALLLIQLFQPELSRIMRRRQESFPALLRAFAKPAETSRGIEPELADAKVSNLDLWRWAIKPNVTLPSTGISAAAGVMLWKPSPQEAFHSYAVQRIVEEHPSNSAERTTAQHVRLPMVEQIVEHRAAHRHVFDVLKLMQTLATDMEDTNSEPHQLVFEPYRSLLAMAATPPAATNIASQPKPDDETAQSASAPAQEQDTRPTFSLRNLKELVGDLISEDTSAQANMASRHELRPGHVLDEKSGIELASILKSMANEKVAQLRVLNGLQFLAPFVSPPTGKNLWKLVETSVDLREEPNPKLRALWGDVRAALRADPRFETTGLCFAKGSMVDAPTGFDTTKEEIPGFVLIDARKKPFWFGDGFGDSPKPQRVDGIDKPFYMSRTLTTVAQYAKFLDSKTYTSHFLFEGKKWFDSANEEQTKKSKKSIDVKGPKQPNGWSEQIANPLRPVAGVTWFEATAYVEWLNSQFQTLNGTLSAYRASLPTELQWECAARFGLPFDGKGVRQVYPWIGGPQDAAMPKDKFFRHANLDEVVGQPTVVGIYPEGHSAVGLADMAGNAWEWMSNRYVENFDPTKSLNGQNGSEEYALRGGSCFAPPDDARCSVRYRYHPGFWDADLGFRVVLSLAD